MYNLVINNIEQPQFGKFNNVKEFEATLEKPGIELVKRLKVTDGVYGYFVKGFNDEPKIQCVLLVAKKAKASII